MVFHDIPAREDFTGRSVATIGTYDGIHLGHQRIIREVVSWARDEDAASIVVTFDRHPMMVIDSSKTPGVITIIEERCVILEELGIDIVYILPFTKEVSQLDARTFINRYLIKPFGMIGFVAGYDHALGHRRKGGGEHLSELSTELGFSLRIVKPVNNDGDGIPVKSSTIRSLLRQGDVTTVTEYLNRDYSIKGTVVRGRGIGRQIGIPTANIKPEDENKLLPGSGIYSGWVEFGGNRYDAVISCGSKPTFDIAQEEIEAHLLNYNGDLYGSKVRVGFSNWIRTIEKFSSSEELVNKIYSDIELTRKRTKL